MEHNFKLCWALHLMVCGLQVQDLRGKKFYVDTNHFFIGKGKNSGVLALYFL